MGQITTIASGTVLTASGQTAAMKVQALDDGAVSQQAEISVEIIVTAVSGTTPSAQFSLLWSDDGVHFAADADTIGAAVTAVGNVLATVPVRAAYVAVAYTITGTTPSFTVTADTYI